LSDDNIFLKFVYMIMKLFNCSTVSAHHRHFLLHTSKHLWLTPTVFTIWGFLC